MKPLMCFDIDGKGTPCAYLRLDNNLNKDHAACYVVFRFVKQDHECHCSIKREYELTHQITRIVQDN